ncbi:MAG: tetratricopeptide (TPR) repeat protein [Candidatus Azotimanducaceae bacterium]
MRTILSMTRITAIRRDTLCVSASTLRRQVIELTDTTPRTRRARPSILTLIKYAFTLTLASMLPTAAAFAIPTEERIAIESELSQPITLKLTNRQEITGNPIRVSIDQIQIASAIGAGEIVSTFEAGQIREIFIPGESYKTLATEWMHAGKNDDALELMSLLYAQRSPLLPLLPASESHFFIYYVDLVLDSPHPARAIAIIQSLRPQIQNPSALRALDDATLESYQTLELHEEALPLAEAWVESRQAYGESALGYYVLGAARLRAEAYHEALDLALHPIVFSSPIPTDKLGECYAVAVSAALGLRERAYAATLFQEMEAREFEWPAEDRTLQPFLKEITDYIKDHDENQPTL